MRAGTSTDRPLRLLLDTHALLWWLAEPARLSAKAHAAIGEPNNQVFVSAASAWELATKVRLGKLAIAATLLSDLTEVLAHQGFELLPVQFKHGLIAGGYEQPHRDPFDRLLAAQAQLEGLTLVSLDPALNDFPCQLLW
ncbi:type II toxin-antitoxin system VapC family toxin [Synechococcus sp. LA31]|uniref:type II toxin-antitoxin system VapC family toxin n=1 Tax=Synechococcus sp. LA31 TaxID=2741953 RepID=UPI001BDCC540|nr:type II toxin-antitoxin system VapC family toxin [Synechococcus sp. LA31]QVV67030.1 type II toxin-antitoxin system VapC family toxin [Synechococcus sp. LA31]